jgi:hypothetical protein
LIPDDCRTTYNKPVRGGVPEIRAGDEFWEHIWNPSYPDFSFAGLRITEKLIGVSYNVTPDPEVTEVIKQVAASKPPATLDSNGCVRDAHSTTNPDGMFRNGNTRIQITQIYQIESGGWLGLNPNHHIGEEAGLLGALMGLHVIVYQLISPTEVRVTKDGVSAP